jgi:hypothetical protein
MTAVFVRYTRSPNEETKGSSSINANARILVRDFRILSSVMLAEVLEILLLTPPLRVLHAERLLVPQDACCLRRKRALVLDQLLA